MKFHVSAALLVASLCCSATVASPLDDTIWDEISSRYEIPTYLLYAISFKESRTVWADGQVRPWPWTLNFAGKAKYYESKEEAAQALLSSLAEGTRNIDIGMMQINYHHNGHHVENPVDLLEPETNIDVGAKILSAAMNSTSDVEVGIGRYFNNDETKARKYGKRVIQMVGQLVIALENGR